MKHFGFLKGREFKKADEREIADYLIKNGLFIGVHTGVNTGFKDGIIEMTVNTDTLDVKPTDELKDEFYTFIMNIFKYEISLEKARFFKEFNDEIYGLDFETQKRIALDYFKKIYNSIYADTITFFDQKKSDNGVDHNLSFNKLTMLYYQYRAYKSNLLQKMKITKYLEGNTDYYIKENLNATFDFSEEIYFESQLQILVELNDRFNFEEDLYFTQIRFDKEKFEKYSNIFKSLEAYRFTNQKIKSLTENQKATIESLYQVLKSYDLIYKHKENFIKFVKDEYNIEISKIRNYDEKDNYHHDERIKLFTTEWQELTSKNE